MDLVCRCDFDSVGRRASDAGRMLFFKAEGPGHSNMPSLWREFLDINEVLRTLEDAWPVGESILGFRLTLVCCLELRRPGRTWSAHHDAMDPTRRPGP